MILTPTFVRRSMNCRRQIRLALAVMACGLLLMGCSFNASVYGLRPISPPVRLGAMFSSYNGQLVYPVVDFGRPSLHWETFTPPVAIPGNSTSPTNITYQLRVWKVRNGSPGELVYEREGLPMPTHTLQKPLEPDTRYFWSVRARFELNGESRLTDWSRALQPYSPLIRADLPSRFRQQIISDSSPRVTDLALRLQVQFLVGRGWHRTDARIMDHWRLTA